MQQRYERLEDNLLSLGALLLLFLFINNLEVQELFRNATIF